MKKVSILIAVRNEEKVLPRLLESITNLDYPKENLEVIFANDDSADHTEGVLQNYCHTYSWAKFINITEENPSFRDLKGKMRALANIEDLATGDFILFTDADIKVPPTWVKHMLLAFDDENIGIVVGCSKVHGNEFFSRMQNLEWLLALSNMYWGSNKNISSTGMGNNMAISAKAFHEIGGFKSQTFSIVEDYAIYKKIIAKGFKFKHLLNLGVLTETLPANNFFEQRRRWLSGAFNSEPKLILISLFYIFLLPLGLILGIYFLKSLLIFSLFYLLFLYYSRNFINQKLDFEAIKILDPILFLFYFPISYFIQFLNFVIFKNVVWKNRVYIRPK